MESLLDTLVTLECAALDRWIVLDPDGYLELQTDDVTYFDPFTEQRVDGLEAMRIRTEPMKTMTMLFTHPRYDMIAPKVQYHGGDVAVLTFNLVNYATPVDGPELVLARWNATEVYRRVGDTWRILHSHWSFVQPSAPQSPGE